MVAGRIGKTGNCPLSRSLYPGRNIQYDDDEDVPLLNMNEVGKETNNPTSNKTMNNIAGVATLLLLIAIL